MAAAAARIIAAEARQAVTARGRFLMAVSGGKTPWAMLKDLASEDVPWAHVHVFQVDERLAPAMKRSAELFKRLAGEGIAADAIALIRR